MSRQKIYQEVITGLCDKVRLIGWEAALDEAHRLINAQGGYVAPDDLEGQGYNKAIIDAIDVIEKLGGMDPLQRGKE